MRYALAGLLIMAAAGAARADTSGVDGPTALCPRTDFAAEVTVHDLAPLTPEQAARMSGMRGLFRVETAGPWRDSGQFRRCQLAVADGRVFAEMFLPASVAAPEGRMTVKATLVVHSGGSGYWYYLQHVVRQP